jgi:methylisocitrate lyase
MRARKRIRASRAAIDASGSDVMLVGRCESFFVGENDLKDVITRMVAYADAGADCLYAPGIRTREQITEVIKAVHPKPVNVLVGWPGPTVSEMAELGVRRISIGGALARVAWGGVMRAAKEIAEQGSFAAFADGYPGAELNKMFAK